MKKYWSFFLILTFGVNHSWAGPLKDCSRIITEMNSSMTLDFQAFISILLREQLISEDNLKLFMLKLERGELINPVGHQDTPSGPVFKNSTNYVSFHQFQKFIDAYNRNPSYLNLPELKRYIQKEYELKLSNMHERTIESRISNFDLIIEFLLSAKNTEGFFNQENLEIMIKKAPQSLSIVGQRLANSTEITDQMKGFRILSLITPTISQKEIINSMLTSPPLFKIIPDLLKVNQTEEDLLILKRLLQSGLANSIKNRLLKKITTAVDPILEMTIQQMVHESAFVVEGLRALSLNKSVGTIHFLHHLSSFYLTSLSYKEAYETYKALILMGEDVNGFINKATYYPPLVDFLFQDALFALKHIPQKKLLEFIEKGLNGPFETTRITAAEFLSEYRFKNSSDTESIEIVKNLWQKNSTISLPSETKIYTLVGIDEDWAYQKIIYYLKKGDLFEKAAAARALGGRSSLKSRNIIDLIYKNGFWDVAVALLGRPEKDLVYFLKQYGQHKAEDMQLQALLYLEEKKYYTSETIELAKIMARSASPNAQRYAIDYLKHLPRKEHLGFWIELASNNQQTHIVARKAAIEMLNGMSGSNMAQILAQGLRSKDESTVQAAITPYLFLFFSAYEKTLSKDQLIVTEGLNELKELNMNLVYQLNQNL